MGSEERAAAVTARLGELLGEAPEGVARRLSSGASRETWALRTPGHGALIAQLERAGGSPLRSPQQAPLLRAARAAGVPVPAVVADGGRDDVLGESWTVVEALTGTTDPKAILGGDGVPAEDELIDSIAAALAAVHRMPADESLAAELGDPLELVRDLHDGLGQPHPVFELAFRRLDATRPQSSRRALVHGDFRLGNLLVGEDGVSGVLDWELTHLGDPLEDLGWLCVRAWRFARPDRPAAGLATREALAAAYERHSSSPVDLDELRWWELLGTVRWGVICVMQAFTHLSGATRSLEHAVIGRRAAEVEWDLLDLLAPPSGGSSLNRGVETPLGAGGGAGGGKGDGGGGVHDRPTAGELLDATRRELGEDVLPLLEGRAAFQMRVALRALGIVEREIGAAPRHDELRRVTLGRFGIADEAALAAAIRSGELAEREDELLEALRPLVRAKLEAANPKYLEEDE
jgi:aminoglycoside phosphotransferase (APT) family kinase protein